MLTSDDTAFGGSGVANEPLRAKKQPMHGFEYSISLRIPAMSTIVFKTPAPKKKTTVEKTKKTAAKAKTSDKTAAKAKTAKTAKAPKGTRASKAAKA